MDRLFACGSRETVVDDFGDHDETHNSSTSSVFSRSVSRRSKEGRQCRDGSTKRQPGEDDSEAYHFKIHLSPPRTEFSPMQYSFEGDQSEYALRKTMSDSLRQLPEASTVTSYGSSHASSSRE